MNNLSNEAAIAKTQNHHHFLNCCRPIPAVALYILALLFLAGLGVSIFVLIVVHNALFFIILIFLSLFVAGFLLWNSFNFTRKAAILFLLRSFPDSDLSLASHGQLVKITGLVSCASVSLESSYEKVAQCVYTSTLLYEFGELGLKPSDVRNSCFNWRLTYAERFSTDFYITDRKSGIRVLVKAGPDCKVVPLITESELVKTNRKCRVISSDLRKWLRDRNLPVEARLLRLEEGYIREGSSVSVLGLLHRNNDVVMIVQPQDVISTGCLWQKLLLPVDVDGLIIGVPERADPLNLSNSTHCQE
ncbi:Ubiquitin-specific protease family C19-related protein [Forsythia ovata]|uniref:Ubiquitin-specific protease family C19-related protein n=1 Tax=Forsythia ovata TaxID=205694 RepID=A0ABD1QR12_9LAMI